jgi:choline-sulfatase
MLEYSEIIDQFKAILKDIVDPEKIDALAKKDQAALVQKFGGVKKIIESGGLSGTPVPEKK